MMKILVVDDEHAIRNLLRINLEKSFQVGEASSGKDCLEMANSFHPNFIILDLGLPDMTGLEVLKLLRQWTKVPILILTVEDNEKRKVELLDAGADDYLTKPFSIPELLARIRVGLRHVGTLEATPIFSSGDLKIDVNKRQISVGGPRNKVNHD